METVEEIIDSDGHILERDEQIHPYLDSKYHQDSLRTFYFFPTLDGWMRSATRVQRGDPIQEPDADRWVRFLDDAGISATVLYPTAALGFGFTKDPEWAADLARAYNDFVYDCYLKTSPRLKAVALLPVQDPAAAARELNRAVTELGMVGGVLPAIGLRRPYGDSAFDPLYEEAQALDTVLAVHGAPQQGLGIDFIDNFRAGVILEHPLSQMIQFTSMVCERLFDRFPRLKVAYLEAGSGWVPYLIERIDQKSGGLASEQVRNHPVYFHAELEEKQALPFAMSVLGEDRWLYASDFPHEPSAEVVHILNSFIAREDLSLGTKRKILCDNTKAMYGLK